jgi:hypothetical protein
MTSFGGQATWTKMTSPRGKLIAMEYHPTIKVNKAEELTYLYTYIELTKSATVNYPKNMLQYFIVIIEWNST